MLITHTIKILSCLCLKRATQNCDLKSNCNCFSWTCSWCSWAVSKDALFGPSSTHYWSIHYWQFTEHRNCFFRQIPILKLRVNTCAEKNELLRPPRCWFASVSVCGCQFREATGWQLAIVSARPGRHYRSRCSLSFTAPSSASIWVEGSKFVWMAGCWTNCARRCWSIAPWWSRHANEHLPSLFSTCPC